MRKIIHLFLVSGFLAACNTPNSPDTQKQSFVDVSGIDSSIKPGDDFFRYVNGRWYDTAKIADEETGVGSYMFLNIPQKQLLQHILDSVSSAQHTPGSIDQKVGDFYASGMDTVSINQRGYEPIKPILARIDAINDVPSVIKFAASGLKAGNRSIVAFSVSPDDKNSGINIAQASQAGIGLPDRDYYFKTDSPTLAIQQGYKKYIGALFQLTGSDPATAAHQADIAYGIEKELSASHKTNIELRDINANYNKRSVAAISKAQPNIGWKALLADLDANTDSIDISQPAYYDKLNTLLKSIPMDGWKIYLKAMTLRNYASALSKPFQDASFEFTKVLSGQAAQKT